MRFALRKYFLFAKRLSEQTATNSNSYSQLKRQISPDTMENATFAHLTKKSNYLRVDFCHIIESCSSF